MITVKDLQHSYTSPDGARLTALEDITLNVGEGEFLAVVGPSGCGKTTLLNVLAGLEAAQVGLVSVQGGPPRSGRPEVGYMLARDCLLPWRKALDNAALALELYGVDAVTRRERARQVLTALGLEQFASSYPAQLSHGMRQRVALARVFAAEPSLILLDEPFSALDAQTRVLVQDTFLDVWERRRTTVLLITHDLSEAISLADRVAIMSARPGRIKAIHDVNLPRPRSASMLRGDERFHRMYEAVWADLRDEVLRAAGMDRDPTAGGFR